MRLEQAEIKEQRQLLAFTEFPPKVNIWRSQDSRNQRWEIVWSRLRRPDLLFKALLQIYCLGLCHFNCKLLPRRGLVCIYSTPTRPWIELLGATEA